MRAHDGNLTTARNRDELVSVVQAYFAAMPAEELALLPGNCRPNGSCDGETIAELAYNVARARSHLPAEPSCLSAVDDFLGRACTRLAWLEAYASRLSSDSRSSITQR